MGARRMPLLVRAAVVIVAVVVLCAIFGRLIAPHSPDRQRLLVGDTLPSAEYWAGTDKLGRDVMSRVIVGARTALWPTLVRIKLVAW